MALRAAKKTIVRHSPHGLASAGGAAGHTTLQAASPWHSSGALAQPHSVFIPKRCRGEGGIVNHAFRATVATLIALSIPGTVSAGPLEDGIAAEKRGDYATAIRLLRPFADKGNGGAQAFIIGGMYYRGGLGVPQDYTEAAKWFQKAAEQGNAGAQGAIASLYALGKGVPQDDTASANWFRKSADQNNARAQFYLGLLYVMGRGVQRDYVTAHVWLNLSAVQGDKKAAEARDDLALHMTSAQSAEAQKLAREWKPLKK